MMCAQMQLNNSFAIEFVEIHFETMGIGQVCPKRVESLINFPVSQKFFVAMCSKIYEYAIRKSHNMARLSNSYGFQSFWPPRRFTNTEIDFIQIMIRSA